MLLAQSLAGNTTERHMPTQISRLITRQGPWDTNYHVYARNLGYPNESGAGIYAGNAPIQPWETSVIFRWTPPADGTWKLIAEPISGDTYGPIGQIN